MSHPQPLTGRPSPPGAAGTAVAVAVGLPADKRSAGHRLRGRHPWVAAMCLAITATACSTGPTSTASGSPPTASVSASASATPSLSPTASTGPVGLAACPAPQPRSALSVFARTGVSPDDLLALPDGTVWVTDPDGGTITHLDSNGRQLQQISDRSAPEGMVARSDGSIVLAEQTTNRLVTFQPPATSRSTLVTLPPRGTAQGIDGIGVDPAHGRLLIPDSPHGTLLAMPLPGGPVTQLAAGLGRDVAATVGPNGDIWVAVEGTHGLARVPGTGGPAAVTGQLGQLDDIVSDGSLLYATVLDAGQVVAIDPSTGQTRVLVTAIGSAQGLAVLAGGQLAVADSTAHVIALLAPCG